MKGVSKPKWAEAELRTRRVLKALSLLARTNDDLSAGAIRKIIEAIDLQWIDTQRGLLAITDPPAFTLEGKGE